MIQCVLVILEKFHCISSISAMFAFKVSFMFIIIGFFMYLEKIIYKPIINIIEELDIIIIFIINLIIKSLPIK